MDRPGGDPRRPENITFSVAIRIGVWLTRGLCRPSQRRDRRGLCEVFQNHFEPGVYVCAKCGYELFSSHSKYAHSSPWPAFTETIHADSVAKRPEHNRPGALKVSCGRCGNGLGHEFLNDGPKRGQSRF